jgi:uncharacterized protein with ParB-like and HNH nuclease domain
MSEINIQAGEYPILKIFSNDFIFNIPSFQRPYAWTTEQSGELLEDIITFKGDGNIQPDKLPPYFLGSIVLIKGNDPNSEVIDGQQRLTTLTILLSVLRYLVPQEHVAGLTSFIYEKGIIIAGIPDTYRLTLRPRDNQFFQDYIQKERGIELLKTSNDVLKDSQLNIQENALLFLKRLEHFPKGRLVELAQYVITRCFLVVVSTPDFDSAYRIFSVLNDRGLPLYLTDILKAEVIGEIHTPDKDKYNTEWEDLEALLGRETFQNLFAHIRTIYRKVKSQDTILKEFRLYVLTTDNPQHFIDKVLKPYAEAFFTIKNACYQSIKDAEQVNNLLKWLNQIDNSDWIPPAILFLSRYKDHPTLLLRFFTELERLAAGMMILRANVNKRIERYGRLLTAIEICDGLFDPDSPLQLTNEEQIEIVTHLEGDLYHSWFCKYVLLRLDESLSAGGVFFDYPIISIEHVLPQNPKPESIWMKWFPLHEEREKYVHCLGNLVLLSRRKNSEAQNYEFETKKEKYFKTSVGIVPFPLTTQVLQEHEWTPEVIEGRQQELINRLRDTWRLN